MYQRVLESSYDRHNTQFYKAYAKVNVLYISKFDFFDLRGYSTSPKENTRKFRSY